MTNRFAAQTSVPVEKSKAEIEAMLAKYGADSFASGWEGDVAQIAFRCRGRFVRFRLTLPSRTDERFTIFIRKTKYTNSRYRRSDEEARRLWEQGCRQAWRALALVVKAKLEAVESGISTFEEEFLAHIVLPDQRTVSQFIGPAIKQAYETGKTPEFVAALPAHVEVPGYLHGARDVEVDE